MVDEEWDVIPEPTDATDDAIASTGSGPENGSSPRLLWEGLLGLVVGLLSLPLIADGFMHLVARWIGPHTPVPFPLWASGLAVILLIEVAIGVGLRRISDMCAITFAIAAFFSILETVGMMTDLSPLMLPKLG